MKRRGADNMRPARRRMPSQRVWCLLPVIVIAGLVLLLVQHQHQHQQKFKPTIIPTERTEIRAVSSKGSNFTAELLSSTSFARQLADQVSLGKAYIVIAKEHGNLQLAWELSEQIRNSQRLLSQSAIRGEAITHEEANPVLSRLAELIYKAQESHYDISTTIITLKNHVTALMARAKAATVQSSRFGEIAAESMPKSLLCLTVKLVEEWFSNPALQRAAEEHRNSPRLVDNNLYHFCIFSDNVLATSVVVNSTVSNAAHPQQLVFHIVTRKMNYAAMTTWFLINDFKGCTIDVCSVEEFSWLNASYSPLLKQLLDADVSNHPVHFNSVLDHLRFYIPQVLPQLEKVVFLDDDVVVQKDLTPLFSIELHNNVIGAVETCLEDFNRYYNYLNFSHPIISSKYDPQACAWSFGMNIFDLIAWKRANATATFHYWQERNADKTLWRKGTVPAGLLTFYGLMEPLDRRWHVLGLGYNSDLDARLIESAAVLHYNGHRKPWMSLAITRYKPIWEQYVNASQPSIQQCAVTM